MEMTIPGVVANAPATEPQHWTDDVDARAAELFQTLSEREIRRRQDLAAQQLRLAYQAKNERAMTDLRRMQDALTREMFRRTEGDWQSCG